MRFFQVLIKSFVDVWNELFLIAGLSLLWWLAVVTIVGGPPATTALCAIGYRLAREQRVNLDFAKEAFKAHIGVSWRLGLLNLVVVVLLAVNFSFYLRMEGWLQLLAFVILYLSIAWLSMLMYAYPMINAMAEPSIRAILRNTAIIAFANPFFSMGMILVMAVISAVSFVVPVLALLLLPGFLAVAASRALADRLDLAEERQGKESS